SAKYGSLSTPHGKISVTWDRRMGDDGVARVAIAWRESGAPPVTAPDHAGYGTKLIRNLIPYELGGAVDLVFAPEGLRCDIEIPLAAQSLDKNSLDGESRPAPPEKIPARRPTLSRAARTIFVRNP